MSKKKSKIKPTDDYNKAELFKREILPLRNEFMKACKLNDIPTIVTSAVANMSDGSTQYSSDMVSAITNDIPLNDDKIPKIANVLNGFDVVERKSVIEFEI